MYSIRRLVAHQLNNLLVPGQHEDARMCIAIAMTAGRMGATLANHTQVMELHKYKDETGKEVVGGARVKDMLTGNIVYHQ